MLTEEEIKALQEENASNKKKVDEFRDTSTQHLKDKQTIQDNLDKFKDIDLEKYNSLIKKEKDLEDDLLIKKGDYDKLLEKQVGEVQAKYNGQIEALETGKTTAETLAAGYKASLDDLKINDVLNSAIQKVSVPKKGALIDLLRRAKDTWTVNENSVPVAKQGETLLYGKDGKAFLTAEEWVANQMIEAPYLFEQNTGGGAPGSGAAPTGGGKIRVLNSDAGKWVGKDRSNIVFVDTL